MDSQSVTKRVAVAITANGGDTLCGFRTTSPALDAGRMFASTASRLRRAGQSESAPVVVCVESSRGNYRSIPEAERELERALGLPSGEKATAEIQRQR